MCVCILRNWGKEKPLLSFRILEEEQAVLVSVCVCFGEVGSSGCPNSYFGCGEVQIPIINSSEWAAGYVSLELSVAP